MYSDGESSLGERGRAGAFYDNGNMGRSHGSYIPPRPSRRGTE